MDDPFYRYKMPKPVFASEKHGIRIKNFKSICLAIKRNEEYLINYLKKKLGTTISIRNDTILIKGNVSNEEITTIIQSFIEEYVLCEICSLPETDFYIDTKNKMFDSCRSCGNSKKISNTDPLYKIIKKYPNRYTQKL